jgi:hypothetical protein
MKIYRSMVGGRELRAMPFPFLMIRSSVVRNHVKKCLLRATDISLLVPKGEEAAMQKRKFDGDEVARLDLQRGDSGAGCRLGQI